MATIIRDGYPLHSPSHYRLWFVCTFPGLGVNNAVADNGINGHGLLHEAKEELTATLGSPPIETEGELIQIVVQVFMTDGSLVRSHQLSSGSRTSCRSIA